MYIQLYIHTLLNEVELMSLRYNVILRNVNLVYFHTDKHNCIILHCSIVHNLSNQPSLFSYIDYFQFSVISNTRVNMSASEYFLRINSLKEEFLRVKGYEQLQGLSYIYILA